jgi:hypothetical protein
VDYYEEYTTRTDKITQGYYPVYKRIAREIGPEARVCEIGVYMGESLKLWKILFPRGFIVGVDNIPTSRWPEGTATVISEQDSPHLPKILSSLIMKHKDPCSIRSVGFDLIVDDASHDGTKTWMTYNRLWPLVAPGGYYVIEDWYVGFDSSTRVEDPVMLSLAGSFMLQFREPGDALESAEYRYGMIILRKAPA